MRLIDKEQSDGGEAESFDSEDSGFLSEFQFVDFVSSFKAS